MKKRLQAELLETYNACLANAGDLIGEAEELVQRGSFPRSYVLAFTAIEEISKSQLVADLFTGYITRKEFDAAFRDHRSKIARAEWIVLWAHGVFDEIPKEAIRPAASKRMAALYVDVDDKLLPITPKQSISEQDAREMIRIAEAGLDKIRRWEAMGVQIGTKGFMK